MTCVVSEESNLEKEEEKEKGVKTKIDLPAPEGTETPPGRVKAGFNVKEVGQLQVEVMVYGVCVALVLSPYLLRALGYPLHGVELLSELKLSIEAEAQTPFFCCTVQCHCSTNTHSSARHSPSQAERERKNASKAKQKSSPYVSVRRGQTARLARKRCRSVLLSSLRTDVRACGRKPGEAFADWSEQLPHGRF